MEPTVIVTANPTFAEIKHNALVFLRLNIKEMDEYLAGDCSPENYELYASIREKQCAKLRRVEAATCREELREKESEQYPSKANSHHTTREQAIERRAAQERLEEIMQQTLKLRGQTYRCSEEEKPALEVQIQALLEENRSLYYLAIHPLP